jgi:hypothetical protein
MIFIDSSSQRLLFILRVVFVLFRFRREDYASALAVCQKEDDKDNRHNDKDNGSDIFLQDVEQPVNYVPESKHVFSSLQ